MLLNLGRWYLRWVLWLFFWENPQIIFEKLNQTLVAPFFLKKKKIWRYHYLTPVYQKSWWYDLQLLRYRVWQTGIGSYGSFFPFYHPKNQKKSELKKNEKIAGYIIILHKCTKNINLIRYGSSDTEWDR